MRLLAAAVSGHGWPMLQVPPFVIFYYWWWRVGGSDGEGGDRKGDTGRRVRIRSLFIFHGFFQWNKLWVIQGVTRIEGHFA